jgi:hypothetical protein
MTQIADIMRRDRCSWSEAKARASVPPVRLEPLFGICAFANRCDQRACDHHSPHEITDNCGPYPCDNVKEVAICVVAPCCNDGGVFHAFVKRVYGQYEFCPLCGSRLPNAPVVGRERSERTHQQEVRQ